MAGNFKKEKVYGNDQCEKCKYIGEYWKQENYEEWECRHKNHKYKSDAPFEIINPDNDCKLFQRKRFLGIF